MTIEELSDDIEEAIKIRDKINAAKGGDTWVKIQGIAARVPAAVKAPVMQIDSLKRSALPADRARIAGLLKTASDQIRVIDLKPINTYIKEHGTGGSKTRGILSTAAQKAAEKARVALAGQLVAKVGLIQIHIAELMKDYPTKETVKQR